MLKLFITFLFISASAFAANSTSCDDILKSLSAQIIFSPDIPYEILDKSHTIDTLQTLLNKTPSTLHYEGIYYATKFKATERSDVWNDDFLTPNGQASKIRAKIFSRLVNDVWTPTHDMTLILYSSVIGYTEKIHLVFTGTTDGQNHFQGRIRFPDGTKALVRASVTDKVQLQVVTYYR